MPLFCTVCRLNLCVCPVKRAKAVYNISYTQLLSNLELLGRFELPTSSLPTTVEPSSPCCIRLCGVFLSKKDEVAACLFHCFRPHVSPCGSRCGSSGNFCIKEAADRLRRHISFCRFSLIIDSGDLLNESLLLLAGFRP